MTLYSRLLSKYASFCHSVENITARIMVALNMDELLSGAREAKAVAMAENLEMLISNIKACRYAFELKSCKDLYQMLCLQYPDFPILYGKIIGDSIDRQERIIIKSFKK